MPRVVFDVRDNNPGNHVFNFLTEVVSGSLTFAYTIDGTGYDYYVPPGTEDAVFGSGVTLKVMIAWSNNSVNLYLNGNLVQTRSFATAAASWTASSVFDLGAYEYASVGGYYACDDLINDFIVTGPTLLRIQGNQTEVTGVTNGSVVTPTGNTGGIHRNSGSERNRLGELRSRAKRNWGLF